MRNTLSASIIFSMAVLIAGAVWAEERTLITPDGLERHYIIEKPQEAESGIVVMGLHGGLGSGQNFATVTGFTDKILSEGAIAVFPDSTPKAWNAFHCCGDPMEKNIDDVSFISYLIDTLVENDHADPERICVTGVSNGAIMAHRLGIELSDKIAAIAPVSGGLFGDEPEPAHPVSAIIINGALDQNVPPEGGQPGGPFANQWDGTPLKPAAHQATFWADANGCDPEPEVTQTANVTTETYVCPAGHEVVRYVVNDGGHTWPGGSSASLDATDVILNFCMGLLQEPE